MKIHLPTKETILRSLEQLYPSLDSVPVFQSIPNSQIYLYGGFIRDLALGKLPKEADILIVSETPIKQQEMLVEKILSKHGFVILGKVNQRPGSANYNYLPPGNTDLASTIDINLHQGLTFPAKGDFTINSLYCNFLTGELFDPHDGLRDLEQGILRSVSDLDKSFKKNPLHIFRAVKSVCQFDLSIEPQTLKGLKDNAAQTYETLTYVADHQQTLLGEWMLDNVFRGLAYHPKSYFLLLKELKILEVFLSFLSDRLRQDSRRPKNSNNFSNPFMGKTSDTYEYNLSVFLSLLANQLSLAGGDKLFKQIVGIFGFHLPNKFHSVGINPTKLSYWRPQRKPL